MRCTGVPRQTGWFWVLIHSPRAGRELWKRQKNISTSPRDFTAVVPPTQPAQFIIVRVLGNIVTGIYMYQWLVLNYVRYIVLWCQIINDDGEAVVPVNYVCLHKIQSRPLAFRRFCRARRAIETPRPPRLYTLPLPRPNTINDPRARRGPLFLCKRAEPLKALRATRYRVPGTRPRYAWQYLYTTRFAVFTARQGEPHICIYT